MNNSHSNDINWIQKAKADGWILMDCAFPTHHNYYLKNGEMLREDELIEKYCNQALPGVMSLTLSERNLLP